LYNTNIYLLAQVVANIPNSSFTDITNFVRKFLVNHLIKAKQHTFAKRYQDLVVGTRGARKNCTQIITVMTNKITTVAGLIELLKEEKQNHQIHLVLQTQDKDKPLYNTKTLSNKDQKLLKLKSRTKKPTAITKGQQTSANKKFKTKFKKEESKIKVCLYCTRV
jgi:hypothetical protein